MGSRTSFHLQLTFIAERLAVAMREGSGMPIVDSQRSGRP